jgi:hypothetical protein
MGMVSVATGQGMMQAQVLRSKLEAFGVPCVLEYESYGQVLGVTVDGLGAVYLMVPEALAEKARALLEPMESDESPSAEDEETATEWNEDEADRTDPDRAE